MSLPQRKFTASELIPGKIYRVTKAFEDYDGIIHSVGESCILKKAKRPCRFAFNGGQSHRGSSSMIF